MFVMGLVYSFILSKFKQYSKDYPALILFTALSFYYPIRPDCELQTIWGHLVKSLFLIFVIIQVWKYDFYVPHQFAKKEEDKNINPGDEGPKQIAPLRIS